MLRTSGPRAPISIRHDSNWSVPELELAVEIGERRNIIGYTTGNDVSARDIGAANPLYLPQGEIFRGCCDEFSLRDGHMVEISIGPIGTLVNPVRVPN